MRLNASCEIAFETGVFVPAILMLRPRSGWGQWIAREEYAFQPRVPVIEFTDIFGNLCQRVVIPPGEMKLRACCTVETPDEVDVDVNAAYILPGNLPESVLHFLYPSRYCPSDQLSALAGEIVRGVTPGYEQVEAIRAWMYARVEYRYGTSTPATTALDTAHARVGVCRDFSHVGIALTRALKIPARLVVGYLHEIDPMDLHAWFEAYIDGRWYTFDPTQPTPRGGRLAVGYGRDAADVAFLSNYGSIEMGDMHATVERVAGPATG